MSSNPNESTVVQAMTVPEIIHRVIELAQDNAEHIEQYFDAVTTPWLFPHTFGGNSTGMLIDDGTFLHRTSGRYRHEFPTDGVYAVACSVQRQEIRINLEWMAAERVRNISVTIPLRKPVW